MASQAKKIKLAETDSVIGYIHNVSIVKTSALKKIKYFNAVIQISRDDFCDVAVFSVEKRNVFVRAQNCRTAVKLSYISKEPSKYFIVGYVVGFSIYQQVFKDLCCFVLFC